MRIPERMREKIGACDAVFCTNTAAKLPTSHKYCSVKTSVCCCHPETQRRKNAEYNVVHGRGVRDPDNISDLDAIYQFSAHRNDAPWPFRVESRN